MVTGSKGFVGRRVFELAVTSGWECVRSERRALDVQLQDSGSTFYRNLDTSENWETALQGIDCVVHCAGRVHQLSGTARDGLAAYRKVNTNGTLHLAKQAAKMGVKRFVFLSTIKVNGEFTLEDKPFRTNLEAAPKDPYALSKYEAELGLQKLAIDTGLEVVIIRPPLIYGPGVGANFRSMIKWVKMGIPLPLGNINNLRSLVYIDNLADMVLRCCEHPNARNKTLLVSDDDDVSISRLLGLIASSLKRPNLMVPLPVWLIRFAIRLLGHNEIATRLLSNLQLDISATKNLIDWKPRYTVIQGVDETVSAFLKKNE